MFEQHHQKLLNPCKDTDMDHSQMFDLTQRTLFGKETNRLNSTRKFLTQDLDKSSTMNLKGLNRTNIEEIKEEDEYNGMPGK